MNKIKVLYEDEDIIIVDKPAGILVHPTCPPSLRSGVSRRAKAKEKETLTSWLLMKYPGIDKLQWPDKTRPGVVHRLDKDTSGLIVLAKTPEILKKLQDEFRNRKIKKIYLALVLGKVEPPEGKIEAPITRGKAGLQKIQEFSYSFSKGTIRPAVTLYKTIKYYKFDNQIMTLVEAMPQTGRMHQIRVHLKYLGHPIIGDPLYNIKASRKLSKELGLSRQFLHAEKLEFKNPAIRKKIVLESELPEDLKLILSKLEEV